jgi:hypothetical protein
MSPNIRGDSCCSHRPSRHRPARGKEPTTGAADRDLPRRHRAEDADRPEPAGHCMHRGLECREQIPPGTPRRGRHDDIDTGPDRHLQQPHPNRPEPTAQPAQPAPHGRRRHPEVSTDGAMASTGTTGDDHRADHVRAIRPTQQHRHRQQHMRHQTRPAPRPPRTQRLRDAVNPPPPRPTPRPQRLVTTGRRAGELAARQPRLDQDRVSLYRHQ